MTVLITRAKEFDLGSTALYRLIGLVLGFSSNALVILVLSRQFGDASYAAFALIASLINLLPFADLGLGASVVNATSDHASGKMGPGQYRNHLSRTRDILLVVCVFVLLLTVLARVFAIHELFLGNLSSTPGISNAAMFTFVCIAVAIPFGIGARILQGLGKMKDVVRIGILGPIIQVLIYVPLLIANAPADAYFYGPGVAYLTVAAVGFVIAKKVSGLRLVKPFASIRRKFDSDQQMWHTAAPFLIISVGMALGFQSHRLLLSQFGTVEDVASYSIVAQFLGPLLAITSVVGQNLWSRYRTQLSGNSLQLSVFRAHVAIFAIIGLVFGGGLVALLPFAASLLTGGVVSTPMLVSVAAGAYLFIAAIHQPSAMLLNDIRGLWFQACCVVLVAVTTVFATILIVDDFGAAAPYLCIVGSMLILQVIPSLRVAFLRIRNQS